MSRRERSSEHEYLLWFRQNADFGPATTDVIQAMDDEFCRETGKYLPEGWNVGADGEPIDETAGEDEEEAPK